MNKSNTTFSIEIEGTENRCPIGEEIGERNIHEVKIPVLSCEGACIRGEIARLAANLLAKDEAPSTRKSAPLITIANPATSNSMLKAIFLY